MLFDIVQIDSFTDKPCTGNPAAVVPIKGSEWPSDSILQAIANENNLSETAYYLPKLDNGTIPLRWFTPHSEVDLCGHATLAAAAAVYHQNDAQGLLKFSTKSGELIVSKRENSDNELVMDFPSQPPKPVDPPTGLLSSLGLSEDQVEQVLFNVDYLVVLTSEQDVVNCKPDLKQLAAVECRGIILSAQGNNNHDIRSRFFAPRVGVDEDPVTGSAHVKIAPHFCTKLNKQVLTCKQGNEPRVGELSVQVKGDRVEIIGKTALYMTGSIYV